MRLRPTAPAYVCRLFAPTWADAAARHRLSVPLCSSSPLVFLLPNKSVDRLCIIWPFACMTMYICACVCVCARVCVRACVRVCVYARISCPPNVTTFESSPEYRLPVGWSIRAYKYHITTAPAATAPAWAVHAFGSHISLLILPRWGVAGLVRPPRG